MGTKLGTTGTSTPHDSDMAYPPGMELHGSKWRIKKRVPQDLLRKHPDLYPSQFLTLKTDESDRRAAASRAWVWLGTLEEEFTRVRETGSKFKRVLPPGAADEIIAQMESILADPAAPQGAPSPMTKAAERRMLRSIRSIVIADMLRYVRLPVAAAK